MTFTAEEIAKLQANTKQIMDFLLPLKKDLRESYTIPFGRDQYGSYQYRLCISPYQIYGGMGRASVALEDNDKTSDFNAKANQTSFAEYTASLCCEWKSIKQRVLSIVESEKAMTDSINNFEV